MAPTPGVTLQFPQLTFQHGIQKTTAIWENSLRSHGFKETQKATAPLLYGKNVKIVQVKGPEAVTQLLVETYHHLLALSQSNTL